MAALSAAPSRSLLAAFLPIARASLLPQRPSGSIINRIPSFSQLRSSILPAALLPIPGILDALWEGILKAVPKKKTSHMKKRHRQMAGKGLKDVTALNKCSACGQLKRAHVLCPYCVQSIKRWFGTNFQTKEATEQKRIQRLDEINEQLKAQGKEPMSAQTMKDKTEKK
ncbi:hypothetical protein WHR41_04484 [Cladosporium halotolerans]|uniref:Large ribosomal subunit protein bL32m n=1 Tax=Cladosporium halotolerans TaxID=1052096 RepID=A0AB34KNT8_9PEZI